MKKRILVKTMAVILILSTGITTLSGCTGDNSGGSDTVNEKQANEQGYYKKNGKWYYQGN
ncbi:MAG: hypothetical protein IJJ74_09505 [Eubacterium sp.]|nr:hypothetical protein [Eubacterium sp.]